MISFANIPGWAGVQREDFGNHLWQLKNSITKVDQVERILGKLAKKELTPTFVTGNISRR